jgi:hypothetical protein
MKHVKPFTDAELADLFTSSAEQIAAYNQKKEDEWQQFVQEVNADLENN